MTANLFSFRKEVPNGIITTLVHITTLCTDVEQNRLTCFSAGGQLVHRQTNFLEINFFERNPVLMVKAGRPANSSPQLINFHSARPLNRSYKVPWGLHACLGNCWGWSYCCPVSVYPLLVLPILKKLSPPERKLTPGRPKLEPIRWHLYRVISKVIL